MQEVSGSIPLGSTNVYNRSECLALSPTLLCADGRRDSGYEFVPPQFGYAFTIPQPARDAKRLARLLFIKMSCSAEIEAHVSA